MRFGRTHDELERDERPATLNQKLYVQSLMAEAPDVAEEAEEAMERGLTRADCEDLIPRLKAALIGGDTYSDWRSMDGNYDDSPDMGVHRYDGGGTWW